MNIRELDHCRCLRKCMLCEVGFIRSVYILDLRFLWSLLMVSRPKTYLDSLLMPPPFPLTLRKLNETLLRFRVLHACPTTPTSEFHKANASLSTLGTFDITTVPARLAQAWFLISEYLLYLSMRTFVCTLFAVTHCDSRDVYFSPYTFLSPLPCPSQPFALRRLSFTLCTSVPQSAPMIFVGPFYISKTLFLSES